jgi:hypothetical protein
MKKPKDSAIGHNGPRVAILITDTYGAELSALRYEFGKEIHKNLISEGFDVFHAIGYYSYLKTKWLSRTIEKLRWNNRLHRIQYIFDALFLSNLNFRNPKVFEIERNIYVDSPEGLRYLGIKVYNSLRFLFSNNYDVVVKTTLSSTFNSKNLINFVKSIDLAQPLYAGPVPYVTSDGRKFVSGACMIINSKTFSILKKTRWRWRHQDLDDVAIGNLLWRKVDITELASINFTSMKEFSDIGRVEFAKALHYRCTSTLGRVTDKALLLEVNRKLEN